MAPEPWEDGMPIPGVNFFPPYCVLLVTEPQKKFLLNRDRPGIRAGTKNTSFEYYMPVTSLDSLVNPKSIPDIITADRMTSIYKPNAVIATKGFHRQVQDPQKLEEGLKTLGWPQVSSDGVLSILGPTLT